LAWARQLDQVLREIRRNVLQGIDDLSNLVRIDLSASANLDRSGYPWGNLVK
jgi:hypothetical protein